MTSPIAILTDSHAQLSLLADVLARPGDVGGVQLVSGRIAVGDRVFTETPSLDPDDVLRAMAAHGPAAVPGTAGAVPVAAHRPFVQAPTPGDYAAAFERASRTARHIISIHASRELSSSWSHARDAAGTLLGRAEFTLLDSRTFGASQSFVVMAAARAAAEYAGRADAFRDVVRETRQAIERAYAIYFVESTDVLLYNRLIAPSHAVLGGMLGLKPILTIEHGRLSAMEKVRTRAHGIERLVEFAVEFTHIQHLALLHARAGGGDGLRALQERVAEAFPASAFPHMQYGASLAGLLGTDALGIALLDDGLGLFESEDDDDEHDLL
jgi:DegV family protein with EDD domain